MEHVGSNAESGASLLSDHAADVAIADAPLGEGAWSVFRSEAMSPVRICLPIDETVATSTIRALAATGMVQVNDSNLDMPESKRRFKDQLKLCSECLRYSRMLEEEVLKMDDESEVQLFERTIDNHQVYHDMNEPFDKLSTWAREITASNHAASDILKSRNEHVEHASVLMHAGEFVNFAVEQSPRSLGARSAGEGLQDVLLDLEAERGDVNEAMVHCVTGVCVTRTAESFSRALFRALRGCVLMQMHHLEEQIRDPVTGQQVYKSAFAAVCTGDASVEKVKHIAQGYNANLYECPTAQLDREKELQQCVEAIAEIDEVLGHSKQAKLNVLRAFYQQCIPIKEYCLKERSVYHTLNMFQLTPEGNFLVADCWIPTAAKEEVNQALTDGVAARDSGAQRAFMEPLIVGPNDKYPTFIRTNKFTSQFQAIVDTYGVPSYQEANPAFFAVAMFPFLFGVMFGDIVHGAMMLVFSILLIMYEDRISAESIGEIGAYLYNGRYMILVMSFCAIYMGFIYNEAISLSLTLFGPSAFDVDGNFEQNFGDRAPYPFGVDPIWRHSENNIQFTNSLKMKMSVILGVSQMLVGIFLKLMNNIYFKRWLDVVVESIPELIFMSFTFGYMSLLIFRKWSIQYLPEPPPCFSSGCEGVIVGGYPLRAAPPMIITTMIKMFNVEAILPQDCLYQGQNQFQKSLLLMAVASLPVLLLGKPLYLRRQAQQKAASYQSLEGEPSTDIEMDGYNELDSKSDPAGDSPVGDAHEHEEFEFGEVFTHQAIHTIEFALGCVSNTASYLRLWALSLAHSQLSEVFYNYILHGYGLCLFGYYPGIAGGTTMIFFSYLGFFAATIGILMGMESLSAFLHALRLQWVEFQSKFYDAQGIAFNPLTFDNLKAPSASRDE